MRRIVRRVTAVTFLACATGVGASCGGDAASPSGDPDAGTTSPPTSPADEGGPAVDGSVQDALVDVGEEAAAPGPTTVVAIKTGGYHTCVLLGSGRLWCWGNNMAGQLGLGTSDSDVHFEATEVPGIIDAVDLFVGRYDTCVLRKSGKVSCWGLNSHRQLAVDNAGDSACNIFGGTESCRLAPVDLPLTGAVKKLALGYGHACALLSQGGTDKIQCWGNNHRGQLGHDPASDQTCAPFSGPVPCTATPSDVAVANPSDLTAGYHHVVAIGGGGAVYVWGDNTLGQRGDGATDANIHATPNAVPTVRASWLAPASGSANHVCVKTALGAFACWGANNEGQCGQVATTAAAPGGVSIPFVSAQLGGRHTCVLGPTKTLSCFGDNSSGELGRDPADAGFSTEVPGEVPLTAVRMISIGGFNGCAVRDDDTVWCWGRNSNGEAGKDPMVSTQSFVPTKVSGIGESGD